MISSVGCKTTCRPSHGLGLPLESTQSPQLGAKLRADHLAALVCPQGVRDFLNWVQNRVLTISRPWSAFSGYVIFSVGCKTVC
jgi:hypothetical protein